MERLRIKLKDFYDSTNDNNPSDYIAAIFLGCALFGIVFHSIFTTVRGPIYLTNHFVGLWLCLLIFFFGLQAFRTQRAQYSRFNIILSIIYFILAHLIGIALVICFAISRSFLMVIGAEIAWSIALVLVTLLNIALLVIRKSTIANFEQLEPERRTRTHYLVQSLNWVLSIIAFIILICLCAGAIFQANGTLKFPPRGIIVDVKLEDGTSRYQKMHYFCDGPRNASQPTFFIDTSVSHAMPKFYGVQLALKALGRRTCIQDKPGVGHADFLFADQSNFSSIYYPYVVATGEKAPFVLVGEGAGAGMYYQFALEHPDMIKGLVLVDAYPTNYEWMAQKVLKNLTDEQSNATMRAAVKSRQMLAQLIKAVGCPFDVMSYFFPKPANYSPAERLDEYMWNYRTDKTWATQYYFIEPENINPVDPFANRHLAEHIRLVALISVKNDSEIIEEMCLARKLAVNSTECQYQLQLNRYGINQRIQLAKSLSNKTEIVFCNDYGCDMQYFWLLNPSYTASVLNHLF